MLSRLRVRPQALSRSELLWLKASKVQHSFLEGGLEKVVARGGFPDRVFEPCWTHAGLALKLVIESSKARAPRAHERQRSCQLLAPVLTAVRFSFFHMCMFTGQVYDIHVYMHISYIIYAYDCFVVSWFCLLLLRAKRCRRQAKVLK